MNALELYAAAIEAQQVALKAQIEHGCQVFLIEDLNPLRQEAMAFLRWEGIGGA